MANSIRSQYQIYLSHSRTPPRQIPLPDLRNFSPFAFPCCSSDLRATKAKSHRSPHDLAANLADLLNAELRTVWLVDCSTPLISKGISHSDLRTVVAARPD